MPGQQVTFLAAVLLLGSGLFLANNARAGDATVSVELQLRFVDADLAPLAITSTGRDPARNTMDLAICATSHPTAAAASAALRVPSGKALMLSGWPAASKFARTRSTLLLSADATASEEQVSDLEKLAVGVRQQTRGEVGAYLVAAPDARVPLLVDLPVVRDAAGTFAAAYGTAGAGTAAYLVRPDGHVGFRSRPLAEDALQEHLARVFAP